jgi:hypothetical protein
MQAQAREEKYVFLYILNLPDKKGQKALLKPRLESGKRLKIQGRLILQVIRKSRRLRLRPMAWLFKFRMAAQGEGKYLVKVYGASIREPD